MEAFESARKRAKILTDELNSKLELLGREQVTLTERRDELNTKKLACLEKNGDVNAHDADVIEINAGGRPFAIKRGVLTQNKGTRLEALFSGRWDKLLTRDSDGRIFIDVNPASFQAIVGRLCATIEPSLENPPKSSLPNDEYMNILDHQIELFGMKPEIESKIITTDQHCTKLHDWLSEQNDDGDFHLLYRSSRDGSSNSDFHSKCDNQGKTLTIIKTTGRGYIFGGYSNTPWDSKSGASFADKAFLFTLRAPNHPPIKFKLKSDNCYGIYSDSDDGPNFGDNAYYIFWLETIKCVSILMILKFTSLLLVVTSPSQNTTILRGRKRATSKKWKYSK